ncbi:DUF2478 domain-containing protein [Telmatospirillum sp.]|uniref:DUF2478 domain-containing protein n=1 Tax=Telmatospirillum sp. TaxID=2079197 RepID=UPI00283EEC98|nr:DUF2478 domain-containing protein [Telmatospirillum sp.]MDR3435845.1 DUF2478 domain-containing protein [Telmatospirillum sp.]
MSAPHIAVAAIVHSDDDDAGVTELLANFALDLVRRGTAVKGLVQRNTPNESGGHYHMDLIDVETGHAYRITQDLGKGSSSCCLDPGAIEEASVVLRRVFDSPSELVVVNRFGGQETSGRGFADEMLQIMAEGVPLLTAVAARHKADWQRFTGPSTILLPPTREALERWFSGLPGNDGERTVQQHSGVLAETIDAVSSLLGPMLKDIVVERAVIGQYFTGVKLSTGSGGAAFSLAKPIINSVNCKALPKAIYQAGKLRGRPVTEFLNDIWEDVGACRALGVAVVNALADTCWRRHPHPGWFIESGIDALTAANPQPGERVVMVGAFVSYVRRLKEAGQPLTVLELSPTTLTADEMVFFRPADQAPEVVPNADLLILTGSTMVNDTMDDLFALVQPETRVAVVGPSVPLLPDILGDRGADILATIRITDPDHFLDVLAEGGGTQGVYDGSAELVIMRRRD